MHSILLVLPFALSASAQIIASAQCASNNASAMNSCFLQLTQLQTARCLLDNTPNTQMQFFECQCDMLKKTYMCFNDPACQDAANVKILKTQKEQQVNQTCDDAKRMGSNITAQLSKTYMDTTAIMALPGPESSPTTSLAGPAPTHPVARSAATRLTVPPLLRWL